MPSSLVGDDWITLAFAAVAAVVWLVRLEGRANEAHIVLLDAAARGADPDSVSFAAGKSHDIASGVTFSQLIGGVVENYGLANANAQQLTDLQAWIREQEALAQ